MKNLFFALSCFCSHSIEYHGIIRHFIPLLLCFREALERIFTKYGPVTGVVVNDKKGGSALVEFADTASARMAANIETGFIDNPFKVKPLFEDGLHQSTNSASHLNKSKHQLSPKSKRFH
jgi:hypothetical protein